MNILVIGNGFDLAHNLPTRYGDFLYFISVFKSFDQSKTKAEDNNIDNYISNLYTENMIIYNEIKSLAENNVWIDYFSSVYENRKAEGKEGWIDFENEISEIIKSLDELRLKVRLYLDEGKNDIDINISPLHYKVLNEVVKKTEYDRIDFSHDFIQGMKKLLFNDLNRLTRCLEIYLYDYINHKDCERLPSIKNLHIDKVLSFNYTVTYSELYDNFEGKIDCDFIHGKANIDNNIESCNMVIGIDEYLTGDAKNNDNEFIQFKKFYQRIYKGTGCKYMDWLKDRERIMEELNGVIPDLNIYIFGHSLDVTDKDILYNLIMAKGAKTVIYYTDKNDLGKKIANLVKVIGEDELIKRTDGTDRIISFKPIN